MVLVKFLLTYLRDLGREDVKSGGVKPGESGLQESNRKGSWVKEKKKKRMITLMYTSLLS